MGNSRTLPTHSPAPACWGCLHASPRARGYLTPFQFPLLTEERVQTTTRLCGLASHPELCCRLAPCGEAGHPQSRLAPHGSCLLLSFNHNMALEPFCPSKALPMKLVSGLCSQNPCLLPILPHCQAGLIPTSRANNCLPVCLSLTQDLSLCLRVPMAGYRLDSAGPTFNRHAD